MSEKQAKLFKIFIIILSVFLVVELIYFGVKLSHDRKNSVFYTVINSAIVENEKNYVGAGFSDYRNSKINKYDKGYDKATVFEIKNNKTVKEVGLSLGYSSHFNDIVKTSDGGYIAVGKIEMTKEQRDEKMSEGLIVKYDKNLKQVWRKNVKILEKTELFKVKLDGDDFIVVGSSVYSEGYIGNHSTGGGILLKYDKDGNEKLRVNNGGPYKGSFNDILIEDNSYVVVGLGKSNSGIIIKYDKSGKKLLSGSFGYTDSNGLNAVAKRGSDYVTVGTKIINPKDLSNYSAVVVVFNSKLEVSDDAKYANKDVNLFSDVDVLSDGSIVACGITGKSVDGKLSTDAVIVKYDKSLYEKESDVLKGNKNDYYVDTYVKDDNIYALGYTNSKLKEYKTNGYDYFPVLKKYNDKLK